MVQKLLEMFAIFIGFFSDSSLRENVSGINWAGLFIKILIHFYMFDRSFKLFVKTFIIIIRLDILLSVETIFLPKSLIFSF